MLQLRILTFVAFTVHALLGCCWTHGDCDSGCSSITEHYHGATQTDCESVENSCQHSAQECHHDHSSVGEFLSVDTGSQLRPVCDHQDSHGSNSSGHHCDGDHCVYVIASSDNDNDALFAAYQQLSFAFDSFSIDDYLQASPTRHLLVDANRGTFTSSDRALLQVWII